MADERVIATKLEQIEQYHGELVAKRSTITRERLHSNTTEQRAIERMFENVIQSCADLAKHIASRDFGFDGTRPKEAIRVLEREGVLQEETAETMIEAVGFRNVLAHQYGSIDYDLVYDQLESGLNVFDEFSKQVANWHRT